jgi:hypothetical protein
MSDAVNDDEESEDILAVPDNLSSTFSYHNMSTVVYMFTNIPVKFKYIK